MEAISYREARMNLIQQLMTQSKGHLNERQAFELADQYINSNNIYEGSPLSHKGINILVKHILTQLNLL